MGWADGAETGKIKKERRTGVRGKPYHENTVETKAQIGNISLGALKLPSQEVRSIFNRIPVCQHFYLLLLQGAVTTNILTPIHDTRLNDFVVDDVKNALYAQAAWRFNCIAPNAIRANVVISFAQPKCFIFCATASIAQVAWPARVTLSIQDERRKSTRQLFVHRQFQQFNN